MRKVTRLTGGALSVVICLTTMLAAPAAARRHRHARHHQVTCGPGTVLLGGQCVFDDPPVGDSNVTASPNPIVMTLGGHVVGSLEFNALLPLDELDMNVISIPDPCGGECGPVPKGVGGIPCGPNAVLTVTPLPIVADANGHAHAEIHDVTIPPGPGGCVPGIYPLIFTELPTVVASPRTYTVFVTLTF